MKERKDITLDTSVMDLIAIMAEGNIGALTAMMGLLKKDPTGWVPILRIGGSCCAGVIWMFQLNKIPRIKIKANNFFMIISSYIFFCITLAV